MRLMRFFTGAAFFISSLSPLEADFTGFYFGPQLGFQSGKAKIDSNYDATFGVAGAHQVSRLSLEGITGGLHFGCGKQFENNFYLGGEVAGRLSSAGHSETRVITNIGLRHGLKVENSYTVDLGLKLGYVHQHFMPYLKAGIEFARYKATFGGGDATLTASSASKTVAGFRPAVGFEYLYSPHWMIGFEYGHGFFTGFSHTQTGIAPSGDTFHKVKPNAGVALLKVSYRI